MRVDNFTARIPQFKELSHSRNTHSLNISVNNNLGLKVSLKSGDTMNTSPIL